MILGSLGVLAADCPILGDGYDLMRELAVLGEFPSAEAGARFPVQNAGPHTVRPFRRVGAGIFVFKLALNAQSRLSNASLLVNGSGGALSILLAASSVSVTVGGKSHGAGDEFPIDSFEADPIENVAKIGSSGHGGQGGIEDAKSGPLLQDVRAIGILR